MPTVLFVLSCLLLPSAPCVWRCSFVGDCAFCLVLLCHCGASESCTGGHRSNTWSFFSPLGSFFFFLRNLSVCSYHAPRDATASQPTHPSGPFSSQPSPCPLAHNARSPLRATRPPHQDRAWPHQRPPPPPCQRSAAARVRPRRGRRPRTWCTQACRLLACGRRHPASVQQLRACAQGGGGGRGLDARRRGGLSPAATAAPPALRSNARAPDAGAVAVALVRTGGPVARLRPPPPRQLSAAQVGGGGRGLGAHRRAGCSPAAAAAPPALSSPRRGRRPRPWCAQAGRLLACGRRRPASAQQLRACAQGGGSGRGIGARSRRAGCSPAAAGAAPELGSSVRAPKAGAAAAGLVRVGVLSVRQWPPPPRRRMAAPRGGPRRGWWPHAWSTRPHRRFASGRRCPTSAAELGECAKTVWRPQGWCTRSWGQRTRLRRPLQL